MNKETIQLTKHLTDSELIAFNSAYANATFRKQFIFIVLMIVVLFALNHLFSYAGFKSWQLFLGSGVTIIVFGVVAVFALINDTAHDIITSMRPDLDIRED